MQRTEMAVAHVLSELRWCDALLNQPRMDDSGVPALFLETANLCDECFKRTGKRAQRFHSSGVAEIIFDELTQMTSSPQ